MIVDPDFFDHWKTRSLVGLLGGDEMAPVYVMRLWAHCQLRREHIFNELTSRAIKAITRFSGSAELLESSLAESGFIVKNGEEITVHEWDVYNAKLMANWKNGPKGGRPKAEKKPKVETQTIPTIKPEETQKEPTVNPQGTDKIRYDKNTPIVPKGTATGLDQKHVPNIPETKRLAAIFGRRETTVWSDREVRAYRKVAPISAQDLEAIETYYAAEMSNPDRITRRDLVTLLNNFPGEVDRANNYKPLADSSSSKLHRPSPKPKIDRTALDQADVVAYLNDTYPALAQRNPPQNTVEAAPEACLENYLKWKQ